MEQLLQWPNNCFLGLIVIFALLGLVLNRALLRLYDGLRRDLDVYRLGHQSPQRIQALVNSYRNLREGGVVQPNPHVVVDRWMAALTVLTIPAASAERLVRFAGSMPVLLGLAGNFIGWFGALGRLRTAWPQVTDSLKPEEVIRLLDALRTPLDGLNTAFGLSIAGLLASLLVNLLISLRNAPGARERLTAELDDYLTHHTGMQGAPENTTELLVSVYQQFKDLTAGMESRNAQMLRSFEAVVSRVDTTVAKVGELVDHLVPISQSVDRAAGSIDAIGGRLGGIVGQMEFASSSFSGGATTLQAGLGTFGTAIERLADAQESSVLLLSELSTSTKDTLSALGDRVEALTKIESSLEQTSTGSLAALRSVVDPVLRASDGLKEQYQALQNQTSGLEETIKTMTAAAAKLDKSATVVRDSQTAFVEGLEKQLVKVNQAQLQQLLDSINGLNHILMESQRAYLFNMQTMAGSFMQGLSHPLLQDLNSKLQRLADQEPARAYR